MKSRPLSLKIPAPKGSTITLTVATEAAKITVPDVRNLSCDQAKAQMGQAAGALEIGGRRIAQHIERHILPLLAARWLQAMQSQSTLGALSLDWQDGAGYVVTEVATPS